MHDVWVVVPMFNEASTIAEVVAHLRQRFDHVLCVDDGSRDQGAVLAAEAGGTVVRHAVNLGQGAALQTGFDYVLRHTDARFVVTFDADGQHRVEDAVAMVEQARTGGHQVVLASRFLGSTVDMPRLRALTLRLALAFSKLHDRLDVTDTHNGLRVLSRDAVEIIRLTLPRMAYASELQHAVHARGLTYVEHPVEVVYTEYSRGKGQSNLNAVNIVFELAAHRLRTAS